MWSLETIFSPTAQQRGARAATSEADAAKQADSLADFPEFELLVAAPEPLTQQLDPVVAQQQDPVIAQRDSEIEELRAQLQPLEELRAQSQELRAEREKMVAELATLREEMRISSEVQQAQANAMRQQLKAEYAAMEDELTSQLKEEVEKLRSQANSEANAVELASTRSEAMRQLLRAEFAALRADQHEELAEEAEKRRSQAYSEARDVGAAAARSEEMRVSTEMQQAQANVMRQQLKAEYAAMEDELADRLADEAEELRAQADAEAKAVIAAAEEKRISAEVQEAQANAKRQQLRAEFAAMEDELTHKLEDDTEGRRSQAYSEASAVSVAAAACDDEARVSAELLQADEMRLQLEAEYAAMEDELADRLTEETEKRRPQADAAMAAASTPLADDAELGEVAKLRQALELKETSIAELVEKLMASEARVNAAEQERDTARGTVALLTNQLAVDRVAHLEVKHAAAVAERESLEARRSVEAELKSAQDTIQGLQEERANSQVQQVASAFELERQGVESEMASLRRELDLRDYQVEQRDRWLARMRETVEHYKAKENVATPTQHSTPKQQICSICWFEIEHSLPPIEAVQVNFDRPTRRAASSLTDPLASPDGSRDKPPEASQGGQPMRDRRPSFSYARASMARPSQAR